MSAAAFLPAQVTPFECGKVDDHPFEYDKTKGVLTHGILARSATFYPPKKKNPLLKWNMFQDPGCLGVCKKNNIPKEWQEISWTVTLRCPKGWCKNCSSSGRWTSSWNPARWNDSQTQSKQKKLEMSNKLVYSRFFIPHPPMFQVFFHKNHTIILIC